ncbi:MAG: phosphatase PAP2 family protein [Acidobacteriota bacterium]|nr:phosphatase PAP2 family protein [Acidobacteriota bacterium]
MTSRRTGTLRFGCVFLLFTISLCCRTALAIQPFTASSAEAADANLESLPDAPSPSTSAAFQSSAPNPHVPVEQQDHPLVTPLKLPLFIVRDGANIAISPAYIRTRDLKWILPLTGAAAAAFATDTKAMTEVVSTNASFNHTSANVSDGLRDGFIAAPIALFGLGHLRNSERMKETGMLGGEAMVDAIVVDELVKLSTFRERPLLDNAQGEFYIGRAGVDSSFISGHSMIAWSSAAVLAGEYHSKWVQAGVYALAAGVSLTRVMGQQHFPSDVLLGSAGGWLIGHYVYRAHHHVRPEDARK